jgi:hypothetical protein
MQINELLRRPETGVKFFDTHCVQFAWHEKARRAFAERAIELMSVYFPTADAGSRAVLPEFDIAHVAFRRCRVYVQLRIATASKSESLAHPAILPASLSGSGFV